MINFDNLKQYFDFRFSRLSHFLCSKGAFTPTDPFTGVSINGKVYEVVKTFDNSYKYIGEDGSINELPKDDTPYEFKNISGRHIKEYSRWYNTGNGAVSVGFTDVVTNLQDLYSRKMRVLDSKDPAYPIGMEIGEIPSTWTELQSYFFLHEDLRTIMGKIDITNATLADMRAQDKKFYDDARVSYADMQDKLGKIDANTDEVEGKLGKIDANTDDVETSLAGINADTTAIKGNTDGVEDALADIKGDTGVIKNNTDEVEAKLDNIKSDTGAIKGNTDEVEAKLDNIKADTEAIKDSTDEVEVKLDKIDQNTDGVETSLDDIKSDLGTIKGNTDEVEGKLSDIKIDTDSIKNNTDDVESALSGIKSDTESIIQNTDEVEAKLDEVKGDSSIIKENTNEMKTKLSNIDASVSRPEEL